MLTLYSHSLLHARASALALSRTPKGRTQSRSHGIARHDGFDHVRIAKAEAKRARKAAARV